VQHHDGAALRARTFVEIMEADVLFGIKLVVMRIEWIERMPRLSGFQ